MLSIRSSLAAPYEGWCLPMLRRGLFALKDAISLLRSKQDICIQYTVPGFHVGSKHSKLDRRCPIFAFIASYIAEDIRAGLALGRDPPLLAVGALDILRYDVGLFVEHEVLCADLHDVPI